MTMIRLNLLPADSQGKRAPSAQAWMSGSGKGPRQGTAPVVWFLVIPAFLIAGGLFAGVYYYDVYQPQQQLTAQRSELRTLSEDVGRLQSQFSGLREAAIEFERQSEVIDILMPPNRILWSEKFNQISECVPDNVYLSHIRVDEEVQEVPTPDSVAERDAWLATPENRRQGTEPALVMVPRIIQTLSIEGISYADVRDRRIQLVIDFYQNLIAHQSVGRQGETRHFMDHFDGLPTIDYNEIQDVAGVEVNAFRLVLRTKDLATLGQSAENGEV